MAADLGWSDQCTWCTAQDCAHECHTARPAFVGHTDTLPEAPAPAGPRQCDHCGRITTAWTARTRDDDRGPIEIIWCDDAHACDAARRAARPPRIRVRPNP
jgi:hypothetical protein